MLIIVTSPSLLQSWATFSDCEVIAKNGFARSKNKRCEAVFFLHKGGLDDAFYCEDNPSGNTLKDSKKTKRLRE